MKNFFKKLNLKERIARLRRGGFTFGRVVIALTVGVVILGVVSLLLYKPPVENNVPVTTQSKLANILPTNSTGAILKVDGVTHLVVSNVTPDEFKALQSESKIAELKQALGVDNLVVEPSGDSLRDWSAGTPESEEGPTPGSDEGPEF